MKTKMQLSDQLLHLKHTLVIYICFTVPATIEDCVIEDTVGALVLWYLHHQWESKQLSGALGVALVGVPDLFDPTVRGERGGRS